MVNISMEHCQYNDKDLLEVKSIIQFGNRKPSFYHIKFFKEVYGLDKSVKIRGLSNFEYEEIALRMYEVVSDTKTINYLFNPNNEEKIESSLEESDLNSLEESDSNQEPKSTDIDTDFPEYVNTAQLTHAYLIRNAFIVYYAMKDYYKDLTLDQVKQIEGINEIAKVVNEKSGRTKEIMDKIEFFREQQKKLDAKISDKQRT